MEKFAGAAIRSSVACILIYERMSTNVGLLEATRTRPLDDGHITIHQTNLRRMDNHKTENEIETEKRKRIWQRRYKHAS